MTSFIFPNSDADLLRSNISNGGAVDEFPALADTPPVVHSAAIDDVDPLFRYIFKLCVFASVDDIPNAYILLSLLDVADNTVYSVPVIADAVRDLHSK